MLNEFYYENLKSSFVSIAEINIILLVLALLLLFVGIILKKQNLFIKKMAIAGLVCILLESAVLLIPRAVDMQKKSFVELKNASFSVTGINGLYDGSMTFFGVGQAIDEFGEVHTIVGTNLCDIPDKSLGKKYFGTVVYAKHSRQIVAIISNDNNESS